LGGILGHLCDLLGQIQRYGQFEYDKDDSCQLLDLMMIACKPTLRYQLILPLSEHDLTCIKKVRRRVPDNISTLSNRSTAMNIFERFVGWSTPIVPRFDYASLAQDLRHPDSANCLARQQGRCPGLEFCHDCTWREGSTRERA
jgi:hypothetical protein